MELQQIIALAVFTAVYAAFATRAVHRAAAALVGALALALLTGPGPLVSTIVVEALLVTAGLMVLAGAVKRSGIASWLALRAARAGRGRPVPILILTAVVTFVLAAVLGPAPAVVLVLPVALLLAVELDLEALPFVLVLSWAALWGGVVLMTAQPSNLWVVVALGLEPVEWALRMAPLAFAALATTLAAAVVVFRSKLRVTNERRARVLEYDASRSLGDKVVVLRTLTALVLVAVGLGAIGLGLPLSPSVVALGGASLLILWEGKRGFDQAASDLDGGLLVFYGALFAIVAALGASGVPALTQALVPQGPVLLTLSALLAAFVDHGAVQGALVPFLQAWKAGGTPSLWVWSVLGTTLGAGVTVWGSASVAAALSLAGQGKGAPGWKEYTRWGLLFGAVNLAVIIGLGLVLIR